MAMTRIEVSHSITLPDPVRVARALRAPELGPKLLFFSGGSALRKLSRRLKEYTHNSIHLITPFDSGGSSAKLREAFGILSIGDLRNRLMALADETQAGNPEIYRLFNYRFSKSAPQTELRAQLAAMVDGEHQYVSDIRRPLRRLVRTHLRLFAERMPNDFDLRGASIGNLILAGGLLNNEGDIASVIFLFSQLVEVRGIVRPVSDADLHLRAELGDRTILVGQHLLTGKETNPITAPVTSMTLVDSLDDARPATAHIDSEVRQLIGSADLICYPMGSFYSSVLASVLPEGVGRAVAACDCPKVCIPNTGEDPEQLGMTLSDTVSRLLDALRADCGGEATTRDLLQFVMLDVDDTHYSIELDIEATRDLGVEVIRLPLVSARSAPRVDAATLSEVLVSLGS